MLDRSSRVTARNDLAGTLPAIAGLKSCNKLTTDYTDIADERESKNSRTTYSSFVSISVIRG